jgi:hypothetical protein
MLIYFLMRSDNNKSQPDILEFLPKAEFSFQDLMDQIDARDGHMILHDDIEDFDPVYRKSEFVSMKRRIMMANNIANTMTNKEFNGLFTTSKENINRML